MRGTTVNCKDMVLGSCEENPWKFPETVMEAL
jgi:hypothetical protein